MTKRTTNNGFKMISAFAGDESGATAIEYGLIALIVGLVVITVGPPLVASIEPIFALVGITLDGVLS